MARNIDAVQTYINRYLQGRSATTRNFYAQDVLSALVNHTEIFPDYTIAPYNLTWKEAEQIRNKVFALWNKPQQTENTSGVDNRCFEGV